MRSQPRLFVDLSWQQQQWQKWQNGGDLQMTQHWAAAAAAGWQPLQPQVCCQSFFSRPVCLPAPDTKQVVALRRLDMPHSPKLVVRRAVRRRVNDGTRRSTPLLGEYCLQSGVVTV